MHHLMTLVCLISRALRPARGLHAAPRVLRAEVRAEARARRANRVRRYAQPLPTLPTGPGFAPTVAEVSPVVPAPRRPADAAPSAPAPSDHVPVVDPRETQSPAAMVPRFYLAHEARQQHARAARVDRDRLGIAVLADIAGHAGVTA